MKEANDTNGHNKTQMMYEIRKLWIKINERADWRQCNVLMDCMMLGVRNSLKVFYARWRWDIDHVGKYCRRNGKSLDYPNNKRSTNFMVRLVLRLRIRSAKRHQRMIIHVEPEPFTSFFACSTIAMPCAYRVYGPYVISQCNAIWSRRNGVSIICPGVRWCSSTLLWHCGDTNSVVVVNLFAVMCATNRNPADA